MAAQEQAPSVSSEWWALYGDATLNELVAAARKSNVDLRLAAARVREAEALLRETGTAFYPEVTGGYGDFGEKWTTDLSTTAVHGESIGGNVKITVVDGTSTDIANAGGYAVAPPPVSPSGIDLN